LGPRLPGESSIEAFVFAGSQDIGEMYGNVMDGTPMANTTRKVKAEEILPHASRT
jgi:hypothetical protein